METFEHYPWWCERRGNKLGQGSGSSCCLLPEMIWFTNSTRKTRSSCYTVPRTQEWITWLNTNKLVNISYFCQQCPIIMELSTEWNNKILSTYLEPDMIPGVKSSLSTSCWLDCRGDKQMQTILLLKPWPFCTLQTICWQSEQLMATMVMAGLAWCD